LSRGIALLFFIFPVRRVVSSPLLPFHFYYSTPGNLMLPIPAYVPGWQALSLSSAVISQIQPDIYLTHSRNIRILPRLCCGQAHPRPINSVVPSIFSDGLSESLISLHYYDVLGSSLLHRSSSQLQTSPLFSFTASFSGHVLPLFSPTIVLFARDATPSLCRNCFKGFR